MDPARGSRYENSDRQPRRSRSSSLDSEEERCHRRRRKEREMAERDVDSDRRRHGDRRDHRDRKDSRGNVHARDKYDDRDAKRRRSRSPAPDSSRRRHDESARKRRSSRSPPRRGNEEKEYRSSREGSARQVSRRAKGPLPSQAASFQAKSDPNSALVLADGKEPPEKEKPNFAPSGLLAAASNSVTQTDGTSIALKYHEPPEARKPPAKDEWKLFVFKGSDILETIDLSKRSCWLIGRELAVVDMGAEHPSISKQHAVIQFRYIEKKNEYGDKIGRVRPYLIDLESANGTSLNKEEIPPTRYLELRDKDMIQFGHSTREYVLMLSPKA